MVSEGGSPQVPCSKVEGDVMKKSKTKFSSQQGFKPKVVSRFMKNSSTLSDVLNLFCLNTTGSKRKAFLQWICEV